MYLAWTLAQWLLPLPFMWLLSLGTKPRKVRPPKPEREIVFRARGIFVRF